MTTATATPSRTRASDAGIDHCVTLLGIDWEGYETLLRLRGDSGPRITYLDGTVTLMSPAFPHERHAMRLGLFVMVVVEELDIPCVPARSTTYKWREKKGGVEPDQSFYLANEARIRGKERLDLDPQGQADPPPDLAIETVNTHDATNAVTVLRRLGVPEIWVDDEDGLKILARRAEGDYGESPHSLAFPYLSAAEINGWIRRPQVVSETEWIKSLRAWVRDTLAPRHRGPNR